ncbi:MAG TPA: nuclear transport factor 2 family protein [Pyrinomonadaceae bacterium]|nr:nuclear transport factor 2 family protein [Pyrinomonadaceae bacterium]
MRRLGYIVLFALAAISFAACGAPATNAPANANANSNSNANAAKPVAAAPTADALFALDKQANEAYIKGDGKFFEGFLTDKFVMYEGGQRMGRADVTTMIASNKCDVKDGWKLEEPQMEMIDADTYAMTYKATFDGSCTFNGKTEKIPSPVRSGSVYVRSGDKWLAVFHGENLIIDPKAPPPPPAKAAPAKKEEAKKDDKAANSNANAAPAPAKPTADPNTDALTKLHLSGWEAFKAKDAKKFTEITTANLTFVDALGGVTSGQANVIKLWTETLNCQGITKVSFTDGFASAVSPTVEILTGKGNADGTCAGQKNGDLYNTAVYVKEGDAWKMAFLFESMPMH